MKKILLLVIGRLACISSYAQVQAQKADFTLLKTGNFVAADSIDCNYFVIPFEGKTAEEIYKTLTTNAALVVNNPDKQVSGVEYSVVKVNIEQHLLSDVVLGMPLSCTGTMYYEFQIKDGRVKVNAPYVGKPCHYGTSDRVCYFSSVVKGYFKKDTLKEKKAAEFNALVKKTNLIINAILGIQPLQSTESEDW